MARYRWVGDGTYRVGATGETVEQGETVELDEHAGEPNDELVPVDENDVQDGAGESSEQQDTDEDEDEDVQADGDTTDTGDESEAGVEPPLDVTEFTVDELQDYLDEAGYSTAQLDALEAAEEATDDPRVGALDAIDDARE